MPRGNPIAIVGANQPARWLKLFGHLADVPLELIDSPTLDIRQAVTEVQWLYAEHVDGWAGPRTKAAMDLDRCLHPEKGDRDMAAGDAEKVARYLLSDAILNDDERFAVASDVCALHQAALESHGGGWPDSCRRRLLVHIDDSDAPSWMDVEAIYQWTKSRWAEVGVGFVRTENVSEAHIRQMFVRGFGWIGLAQLPSNTCDQSLFNKRDYRYNGGESRNKNLDLHETGHNLGLGHFRGIMAPSINDSPNVWVVFSDSGEIEYEDPSYGRLKGMYPGPPLDSGDDDDDGDDDDNDTPPPQPPEDDWMGDLFNAIFQAAIEALAEAIANGEFCDNAEKVRGAGPLQKLRLLRKTKRRLGVRGREWREIRPHAEAMIGNGMAGLDDEDVAFLLEEARDLLDQRVTGAI